ncbi:ATP-dependent DNA helicase RecG [Candidatus Poriferisocius sp.]|uniref:ATP-dependent DNA helicase RecG n=1 Tax=Candidatus Poriferisocius sp. TaxID=3101276 RepID=UPI003B0154EA
MTTPPSVSSEQGVASRSPLTMADFEAMNVEVLSGVGRAKAKALASVEVESVLDLLTYYPRRYIDRTNRAAISDLEDGVEAMVMARVDSVFSKKLRGSRTLVRVTVSDDTGRLGLIFFNQPWRDRQLSQGQEVVVFGKLDRYRGQSQMTNPIVDLVGDETGRIVPVYPQSGKAGLQTREIRRWVDEALRRSEQRGISDPVPESLRQRHGLIGRHQAIEGIHRPDSMDAQYTARDRLVFDELLRLQLKLIMRKRAVERAAVGICHDTGGELVDRFTASLGFPLTGAQRRVIAEVVADMARPVPMHRLLQGDVGAGKTVVAVAAMLTAVQGEHQGALMAPTEVLATQHFLGIRSLLKDLAVPASETLLAERPLKVALLTNQTPGAERAHIQESLVTGTIDIVIGTHALIQEGVEFSSLGVVVVDEQHRFGVEQRAALRAKGSQAATPDVLVMTATPIPRTAAMTVYGDLDVSTLDEMPPGRTPIVTRWARSAAEEAEVWEQVRAEVGKGRQAYVVCPLIDESDSIEARSVTETYERLQEDELAGLQVGLLHGRLTPAEKESVMDLFRSGAIDVLVATTVIEVGVDVPNATVMVIVDADRFGIAQLHQLRGRVGRGEEESSCCLLAADAVGVAAERLRALVDTTDGFELAEADLELRGEGTILGERQKGRNDLQLASLRRDKDWVVWAREAAGEMLDDDPDLQQKAELRAEVELLLVDDDADYLLKS